MEVVWWDDKRMLRKVKVPLPLCDRSLLHALQSLESCFAQLARRSLQANDVTCSFHSQQVLSKIRNSCSTHLPPSPRPPHPPMAGTKSQAIFPGLLRSPVTKGGNLTANATSVNACRSSSVNGKQIRLQTNESHMSLALPQKAEATCKRELGALDFTAAFAVRWTTDAILLWKAKTSWLRSQHFLRKPGLASRTFSLTETVDPGTSAGYQKLKLLKSLYTQRPGVARSPPSRWPPSRRGGKDFLRFLPPVSSPAMAKWYGHGTSRSTRVNRSRELDGKVRPKTQARQLQICQPSLFEQLANNAPLSTSWCSNLPRGRRGHHGKSRPWQPDATISSRFTKRTVGHWSGSELDCWSVT